MLLGPRPDSSLWLPLMSASFTPSRARALSRSGSGDLAATMRHLPFHEAYMQHEPLSMHSLCHSSVWSPYCPHVCTRFVEFPCDSPHPCGVHEVSPMPTALFVFGADVFFNTSASIPLLFLGST